MFDKLWSIPHNLGIKCTGSSLLTIMLPQRDGIEREDWHTVAWLTDGKGSIYVEMEAMSDEAVHRTLVIVPAQMDDAVSCIQLDNNLAKPPIDDEKLEYYLKLSRGEFLPELRSAEQDSAPKITSVGQWANKICSPRKTLAIIMTPRFGHTVIYLPFADIEGQPQFKKLQAFFEEHDWVTRLDFNETEEMLVWEWHPDVTGIAARIAVDAIVNHLLTEHVPNLQIWDAAPAPDA